VKAQQPHKNTIQLVALATTASPSILQNIMFWNIDGAAKHLFIAAVNCHQFFGLISNLHYRTVVDYFTFFTLENKMWWWWWWWWWWWCPVCLSVTLIWYIVDKRSPISATAVLSSYLSTRECICRAVFASSASASRGTKQRRQLPPASAVATGLRHVHVRMAIFRNVWWISILNISPLI